MPLSDAAIRNAKSKAKSYEQRKAEIAAGEERAANSFEVVAREWFARQSTTWADCHSAKELLTALRRVEARGAVESADRTLQNSGQILCGTRIRVRTALTPKPLHSGHVR